MSYPKFIIKDEYTQLYLSYRYYRWYLSGKEKAKVYCSKGIITEYKNYHKVWKDWGVYLDQDTELSKELSKKESTYEIWKRNCYIDKEISNGEFMIRFSAIPVCLSQEFIDPTLSELVLDCDVWLARDKDGVLAIYSKEPEKTDTGYKVPAEYGYCVINEKFHPEVTYETGPKKLKLK